MKILKYYSRVFRIYSYLLTQKLHYSILARYSISVLIPTSGRCPIKYAHIDSYIFGLNSIYSDAKTEKTLIVANNKKSANDLAQLSLPVALLITI